MSTGWSQIRACAPRRTVLVLILSALLAPGCAAARGGAARVSPAVRLWTIHYTSHDGRDRLARVVLPAWYGPDHNPPLPLVISPHGRGATGLSNSKFFGNLPAVGGFAVICPHGMGRRSKLYSYGYSGQTDCLPRLPRIVP